MSNQRLTPFQRDLIHNIDALNIMLPTVGAADEALTRRIVGESDTSAGERVTVHSSDISDPTLNEVTRRINAQENRESYRDAVNAIRDAIKELQLDTDRVLRNEPAITPPGAVVCATKDCTNFAGPHLQPGTETSMSDGRVVEDLCDDCWRRICTVCYVRPKEQYRQTCDACRKRMERARPDEEAA